MNQTRLTCEVVPITELMHDGLLWMWTRWMLFYRMTLRRDFMHVGIPGLVVQERLLRP